MASGVVWSTIAYIVVLIKLTTVEATIENDPTATLACTPTGFSPSFGYAYESGKTIGFEVHIGGVDNAASGSGGPCNAELTEVNSTSYTINVTDLNSGNELPYISSNSPICNGTFDNSADNTAIDYITNVDIVVTETIRGTIQRQKRFPFELKCNLTRDVDDNTASEEWTISSTLTATDTVDDVATSFEFPVDFNFYTNDSRTVKQTTPFEVTMGTDLWIRLKEQSDNPLFKFTTERCWATPDSDPNHATQDIFFDNECGADETVTFVNKNDSSPNFDLNIEAFFFAAVPTNNIFFHCDIFICKEDDRTTANCIQNQNSDCPVARRKRRDAKRDGPVEIRTLTSKQHVVLSEAEIVVPECSENSVYDRESETCTEDNIVQIKGVYLDIPWNEELANTSSKAFKDFAMTKAFQIYALLQLTDDTDDILGVKVVGARKGSTVLDVQIVYKPTIDSSQAFETFKRAIHNPRPTARASKIINYVLKVKYDKVFEIVETVPQRAVGDTDKTLLIVLVVVLAAVVFITGVVSVSIRHVRRVSAASAPSTAPPQVKSFDNPAWENMS